MPGFDMHVHSTASDGAHSPAELVRMAKETELLGMALTDHDTAAGYAEAAAEAEKLDFTVIPGIELSSEHNEKDVHILGYWISPEAIDNDEKLVHMRKTRFARCYDMVSRLNRLGMELDADRILAEAENCGSPGRPLIAKAMIEAGYVRTVKEAFVKWLGRGKPGYVPREKLEPLDAIKIIRKAGGIAVLAHPGAGVPDAIIPLLVKGGLGGIEVFHPEHNPAAEKKYQQIAASWHLPMTGGSDFHVEGTRRLGGWTTSLRQLSLLAAKRESCAENAASRE
ncbi:MAG: PHP domain-containing protein [Firmicutes bacterium]|nr:PHP domain-containing protein [Bacillota bacterium]